MNRKTNVKWNHALAILEAQKYRTQHDCSEYSHGAYDYLLRHNLLDAAFPERRALLAKRRKKK